jgi:hypothetical protein
VRGVLEARSCEAQAARMAACVADAHAGGVDSADGAGAAAACADYAQALQWCEQQMAPFSHPSIHAHHTFA